jgi:hypothetical protein
MAHLERSFRGSAASTGHYALRGILPVISGHPRTLVDQETFKCGCLIPASFLPFHLISAKAYLPVTPWSPPCQMIPHTPPRGACVRKSIQSEEYSPDESRVSRIYILPSNFAKQCSFPPGVRCKYRFVLEVFPPLVLLRSSTPCDSLFCPHTGFRSSASKRIPIADYHHGKSRQDQQEA